MLLFRLSEYGRLTCIHYRLMRGSILASTTAYKTLAIMSIGLGRGEPDDSIIHHIDFFDEGLAIWFDEALRHGIPPHDLEPEYCGDLAKLGWQQNKVPKNLFPHLKHERACIHYSG